MAKDRIGRAVGPQIITDNRKIVTAAGTRVQLETTSNVVSYIILTAETDNTGVIVVGASTVVATVLTRRGIPLSAGDSISLGAVDLADIYLDSTVSGDGVTYLCLV